MPCHEKGRQQEMATPREKVIHNPIPTSLLLSTSCKYRYLLFLPNVFMKNKQISEQNKEVGMGL